MGTFKELHLYKFVEEGKDLGVNKQVLKGI